MKKILVMICMFFVLTGCGEKNDSMENALSFRSSLNRSSCEFHARITADYGDTLYTFRLQCRYDSTGELTFSVTEPEEIAGICGSISSGSGKLQFDDVALSFALLADGQLSPVGGPWVMMKALHGGFLTSAGIDGEYTRVTLKDSYEDDAFTVDVWLDQEKLPTRAEILWGNRRILTIEIESFTFE